jgi:hypothetical protein
MRKLSDPLKAYPIWFLGVLAVTFFHRIFAIGYYGKHTFSPIYATGGIRNALRLWVEFYGESTMLGVSYDVIFAGIAAIPLALAPIWLRYITLLGLSFFYAANYDHIKFNHENINFSTAKVGFDITFIKGMLSQDLLFVAATFFVCGAFVVFIQRLDSVRRTFGAISVFFILAAIAIPLSGSFVNPLWLQSNPFLGSPLKASAINTTREFSTEAFAPRPITMEVQPKHNVLLVYMEGLSHLSLQIGDMEYLTSIAEENISFTRYVGHQLITANGLYASLTGNLPNLARRGFKWTEADTDSESMRGALPNLLRAQGYKTAFLQSALLSFMSKDEIMPRFGYTTVLGRNTWESYYSEDGWGIDDRALFEHAIDYIDTLPQDEPWFVSVLTTGTHALYNVPSDFLADNVSDRYRALRYLDNAINEFMSSLQERGLLENTIIVFTSDESRERSISGQIKSQLALNWLPLIVVHPSGAQATFDSYTTATQLPDLISDFQTDDVDTYLGTLRTDDRPLVFGNVFSKRMFWYDSKDKVLLACVTVNFACAEYTDVIDPFVMSDRLPNSVQLYPKLQELVIQADIRP